MSQVVTFNGTSYTVPGNGERNWGTNLATFLVALGQNALAKAGGAFTLIADANFGAAFGLIAPYFKSATANIAGAGVLRLANADAVGFRNVGNSADLLLQPHADGVLQYNSVDLVGLSLTQALTNKTLASATANTSATGVLRLANADGIGFRNAGNSADLLLQPHADGVLQYNAVDLVNLSASQTLTNKTLTAPTVTSSPSVAPAILHWGVTAATTTAGTYYLMPGFGSAALAAAVLEIPMPAAGKLSNLYYCAQTAQSGGSLSVTVFKNGVSSGITVNALSIGTAGVSDTTHTVTVVAGDRISIQFVEGATVSTAAVGAACSLLFTQA